jgi:hypothetical protein
LDRSGFHGDKNKRKYFYFYKKKGYKYEDKLGSKKIRQPFYGNGAKMLNGIS